jgi:N-acetylneuraminic acid mutarotase
MFQQKRATSPNPSSWRIGRLTSLLTLLLLLAGVSPRLAAQAGEWTWMGGSDLTNQPGVYGTKGVPALGNVPGGRSGAATWMDASGNLWLFGGLGYAATSTHGELNDLWKYTPSTGEWTWMSGSNSTNQLGVYGTKGVPAAGNVPGIRDGAVTWMDADGNLWLFGGVDNYSFSYRVMFNDLWKYTPSTGEWTWMGGSNLTDQAGVFGTKGVPAAGNVPGGREQAVCWMDASGDFWLFGGWGYDASDAEGGLNDLWRFRPATGEWTWMSGGSMVYQDGVYGTKGVPAVSNIPGNRYSAVSWTDSSGNFWLLGGTGPSSNQGWGEWNDLWKYTPATGEWTWVSGSNSENQLGVYGTKGVPAAGNVPGARTYAVSWTDSSDLWLFGGRGNDSSGGLVYLNDLWKYTPSIGEWTWISGSSSPNQFNGVYGTKGVPAAGNVPGDRWVAVGWMDSSRNLWLFGGWSIDANGDQNPLNDLWKYTLGTTSTPSLTTPAPGSTLSGSTATFAWSNPGNLARFVLRLGTTGFGSTDVFSGAANTGTTEQVSGIPTNGAYLYATLWYFLNGKWQYANATYTETGTPTPPALTTPAPGSTLPGSTVTFGWDPGAGSTRFVLRLGTTGPGSMDVYSGASTTATSVQVSTVPTNGAKLYARLWYYLNETWKYVDATYTEARQ